MNVFVVIHTVVLIHVAWVSYQFTGSRINHTSYHEWCQKPLTNAENCSMELQGCYNSSAFLNRGRVGVSMSSCCRKLVYLTYLISLASLSWPGLNWKSSDLKSVSMFHNHKVNVLLLKLTGDNFIALRGPRICIVTAPSCISRQTRAHLRPRRETYYQSGNIVVSLISA